MSEWVSEWVNALNKSVKRECNEWGVEFLSGCIPFAGWFTFTEFWTVAFPFPSPSLPGWVSLGFLKQILGFLKEK